VTKDAETERVDLRTPFKTVGINIAGKGPISIQPIVTNLCGAPTYSVEVSNDDAEGDYVTLDSTLCDLLLTKGVQIESQPLPWKFLRISTSSLEGDSGFVIFKLCLYGV
jgi:hypothetical protein